MLTRAQLYALAQRFQGLTERPGNTDTATIVAMLSLDAPTLDPLHDEIAWCSAFVNTICWLANVPRSKSWMARSWTRIGTPIDVLRAEPGDVVILRRGSDPRLGHVGFFAGADAEKIEVLGGNQSNSVNLTFFPFTEVIAIRRVIP